MRAKMRQSNCNDPDGSAMRISVRFVEARAAGGEFSTFRFFPLKTAGSSSRRSTSRLPVESLFEPIIWCDEPWQDGKSTRRVSVSNRF